MKTNFIHRIFHPKRTVRVQTGVADANRHTSTVEHIYVEKDGWTEDGQEKHRTERLVMSKAKDMIYKSIFDTIMVDELVEFTAVDGNLYGSLRIKIEGKKYKSIKHKIIK